MSKLSFTSRRKFMASSSLMPLVAAVPRALATPVDQGLQTGSVLVAYFSRTGNTRVIARQIRRAHAAILFEIEPAAPYPEDYLETVEQARRERDKGYRPPLKAKITNLASYQTVFLGFPIWGETTPPVIRAFLAAHDFSGKTIIPFITHGGYGVGNSQAALAAHAPGARLLDTGLIMQADSERATLELVTHWLGDLDVKGRARR
jgi:flavodoxin